uniref:Uncharacterized protein n=1 Tax=Rhodosorus marinus TaxID=101924 RepID=A0A7S0BML9_9RHOD|mmetsp:Transcript_23938/g.34426  ORF Transcript_23938/g.34426 Transcript_23938/m.34426 type:complete len:172 (+) Transcript_23938:378-893(+)|eukprot:CAMPEP_0184739572 /NCGR_PEP_ID=MMETSP0315-20130426/2475_1 /TAXON_ID=101924 /ORGANISM="Rhodosorus marinus, Strain UTEX LB 2760" /LENGTH=171 /DNA_ID=CAMNT_0027208535 /DNA_START=439 /DNA_END=954 /DNA_ORIENTATION=+
MVDRRDVLKIVSGSALSIAVIIVGFPAIAESSAAKGVGKGRLFPCPQTGACLSSSSSNQPSKYIAPWSYEGTSDEATSKLLDYANKSSSLKVVAHDGDYVWLVYEGGALKGEVDIEFKLRKDDQIVTIRAASRRTTQIYAFSAPSADLKALLAGVRQDLGWEDLDKHLLEK